MRWRLIVRPVETALVILEQQVDCDADAQQYEKLAQRDFLEMWSGLGF